MAAWRLMRRVLQAFSWVATAVTALTFSRYTFCPLRVAVSQNMPWGPYEEILTSLPFLYIIWFHSFASVSASALGYDIVLSLSSSYKQYGSFFLVPILHISEGTCTIKKKIKKKIRCGHMNFNKHRLKLSVFEH